MYFGGTVAVILLVHAHRTGRTQVLATRGRRRLGLPRAGLGGAAGLRRGGRPARRHVGGLWDIGYHIDNGRDDGPLGNPGHWPLLLGIFTTFAAGILALGMADQKPRRPRLGAHHRRLARADRRVMLMGCMFFGSPPWALDDVWHRIYGQDVTLWSRPTSSSSAAGS